MEILGKINLNALIFLQKFLFQSNHIFVSKMIINYIILHCKKMFLTIKKKMKIKRKFCTFFFIPLWIQYNVLISLKKEEAIIFLIKYRHVIKFCSILLKKWQIILLIYKYKNLITKLLINFGRKSTTKLTIHYYAFL